MGNKYKLVVLRNENELDHKPWINALNDFNDRVDYSVVDITRNNWMEAVISSQPDYLLAKPGGLTAPFKQLYDERIMILSGELHIPVFPTIPEILIYENKRYQAYWLKANSIPHPETHIFYHKNEALDYINQADFPVMSKINIGASGKGVRIIENRKEAEEFIETAFSRGIRSKTGPRLDKGNYVKRIVNKIRNPAALRERLNTYRSIASDYQKGFILFQEFLPHEFEWRVVRIGDSFFAHKKIVKDKQASGSLIKGYENPPISLLDFVRDLTDKHNFYSQAVDIFEDRNGQYLVNEMQCIFGQSDPWQMKVNDVPGRYVYRNENWEFEQGDFNRNQSFNLRVEYVLSKLDQSHIQ